jgi:hypothetical protein
MIIKKIHVNLRNTACVCTYMAASVSVPSEELPLNEVCGDSSSSEYSYYKYKTE